MNVSLDSVTADTALMTNCGSISTNRQLIHVFAGPIYAVTGCDIDSQLVAQGMCE